MEKDYTVKSEELSDSEFPRLIYPEDDGIADGRAAEIIA